MTTYEGEKFGQTRPPLSIIIKSILERYPDGQIFKEMIQNADDAGAKTVQFFIDSRQHGTESLVHPDLAQFQGPALIATNDASFSDADWKGIQRLQQSIKAEDPFKVGRFGIGFNSVYHITDVPTIISGEKLAYLDPQGNIWPGESGRLFRLANLQGSDALAPFNGIAGFNSQRITSYPKTLFRFPLRHTCSNLSENLYSARKLEKLTDALREEAKYLLLFLRSVNNVEVYNIPDESGACTLCFSVQIANENQRELGQKRSKLMDELRYAHASQPYSITQTISFTAKFVVKVTDNHSDQPGYIYSTWLVANCIGTQNSKDVAMAAKKQKVFPWVGVSLELPITPGPEAQNCLGGRIYCFLPLPIEETSNLPVNVNGTFSLNDERRTLKWPGRERTNDPKAEWNRLLVTELLPPCYAMLLEEGKTYLQPEQLYDTWPYVKSLRNSDWEGILVPLLNKIFSNKCFWSSTMKKWITHSDATFIPPSTNINNIVTRVLTVCGVNVISVPKVVWKAIEYHQLSVKTLEVKLVTPELVRSNIMNRPEACANESCDSKLELLSYCLHGYKFSELNDLNLLPIANGTFVAFQNPLTANRIVTTQYLCTQECPSSLLPNIGHLLVDVKDEELQSKLHKVADGGKTQLQILNDQIVAKLLPQCFPPEWAQSQTVTLHSSSIPIDWFQTFWNWVKPYELSNFVNQLILPLAVKHDQHLYGLQVTRLVQASRSTVVYIDEHCSPDLLSALTKLQVQYTVVKHAKYLDHKQLFSYIHSLNPAGVLTAIANANHYKSTLFSESEVFELQRFFGSCKQLNDGQQNVLKNLTLLKGVKKGCLYSAIQASNDSWGKKAVRLPLGPSFPPSSLPSNLVVLSGDNDTTLLQQFNELVEIPNTLLNFILGTIFPMISHDEFPEEQLDSFMEQVLKLFQKLKDQDSSISPSNSTGNFVTKLSSLQFLKVNTLDRQRRAPGLLYDPSNHELKDMYQGEAVFPIEPFSKKEYLPQLRECSLRVLVTAQEIISILNATSKDLSDVPISAGNPELSRINAVLSYICDHDYILSQKVEAATTKHSQKTSQTLKQKLLELSKNRSFLPICSSRPVNYPDCLEWKGAGKNADLISLSDTVLVCDNQQVDSPSYIVGSQMYVVNFSKKLCTLFSSRPDIPPICFVLAHFKHVIENKDKMRFQQLHTLVHQTYSFLCDNLDRLRRVPNPSIDLHLDDWIWIQSRNVFVSPKHVFLQQLDSFEYSLQPYIYQLPEELKKQYSNLFTSYGVHQQLTNSLIISTLKMIKEDQTDCVSAQQAWRMVEHILTWLTDGGDSLASSKLKANEQLYVPIESTSERPQLIEVQKVVYTDLKFLKGSQLSLYEAINFIHHKVAHLAKSLEVKPLSSHLNLSEDAFGDVGQHEPLVTRLKNILRDYKDGLTIIKELLQNADDAEATELNICYDARTHVTKPEELIFSGMSECHGPALIIHNNAVFTDEDFENITKLAGATKLNKPLKIGKFGVGFCSIYHITDVPSFISRDWLYIFDPTISYLKDEISDQRRRGKRIRFTERLVSHSKQLQPYLDLFGFRQDKTYEETLFRLPFRKSASAISSICDDSSSRFDQLLEEIRNAGSKLLLFLKNIEHVQVHRIRDGDSSPTLLLDIQKSHMSTVVSKTPSCNAWATREQVSISDHSTSHHSTSILEDWLVSTHDTYLGVSNKPATASVACSFYKIPAASVTDKTDYSIIPKAIVGEEFCFLPLGIETGLPVHISSNFAVLSDRSGIYSSDTHQTIQQSKEIKWNIQLMESVIPIAYHTLLLALQRLCQDNIVPVDHKEFEFHLLWPLRESLTTHHPWDTFLPELYKLVFKSWLCYSTYTKNWLSLSESRILSPDIPVLCYSGSEKLNPPECVIEVLEHLHFPLIVLPSPVKTQLQNSIQVFSQCLLDEEEFLNIFFNQCMNSEAQCSICTRNRILFLLLEVYAVTPKPYMTTFLKTHKCVPCVPKGHKLKNFSEIVDPCNPFSKLFESEDEKFPADEFHNNKLTHTVLEQLGMVCDTLNWDMLIDRASIIAAIHATNSEWFMNKASLIIKCIDKKLYQQKHHAPYPGSKIDPLPKTAQTAETKRQLSQLKHISFLPVTQIPDSYPKKLNWGGKSYKLMNSVKLLKHYQAIYLVGSQMPIVLESDPEEGGCKFIPPRVCRALGIQTEPRCRDVVNHLCHIIDTYHSTVLNDNERKWIENACDKIYKFFEEQLSQKAILEQDLNKLTEKSSIWTGNKFIDPTLVARSWTHDGPYLYGLPHLLKTKDNVIKALRINEKFSSDQLLDALDQIHKEFKDKPLEERVMKIIPELALELCNQLRDSELTDHQVCYLPDEKCVMHDTRQLSYDDTDTHWFKDVDHDCQFVHSTIPRQTAVKLRVELVRARHLKKYKSTHKFEGPQFGQRVELTQRIKSILYDYPCDVTVIKELLQNADDARATKMYVILDERHHGTDKLPSTEWKDLQGPALLIWNNAGFSEDDLQGIQNVGLNSKRSKPESIGQFGVGFNVVYHVTDCPSFFTNGKTLCVFDPHCRYVPGATGSIPGARYDNLDKDFWSDYSDLKQPYLQDKLNEGCPNEITERGTLFRFPLRHNQELVDQSEFTCKSKDDFSFGIQNEPMTTARIMEHLKEWVPKMKEALIFLNYVKELKFFVIKEKEPMILTHHYEVVLDDSALSKQKEIREKSALFTKDQHEPFVVQYHLTLNDRLPNNQDEKYLIQQGVGDMHNPEQHWEYLPKHGIAARKEGHAVKGQVFCGMPLPRPSCLPVHVNGNFILHTARRGFWQVSESQSKDDRENWNRKMIEAISSAYVHFLINCQEEFVCQQPYESLDKMLNAIKCYYNIFPSLEGNNPPEAEMKMLAELVYKGLYKQNSEVLVEVHQTIKNNGSTIYKAEWHPLLDEEDPSKQTFFWDTAESEEYDIVLLLKSIGMHLSVAPLKLKRHFSNVGLELPQALPHSVFKYYSKYHSQISPDGKFPCQLENTSFKNIENFKHFTLYVIGNVSKFSVCCKFPDPGPYGLPLLLTADEQLHVFCEDDKVLRLRSDHNDLFHRRMGQLLHPSLLDITYPDSYFLEPNMENWHFVQSILEESLPPSLHNKRVNLDEHNGDTERMLKSVWRCVSSEQIFTFFLSDILEHWAILLSTTSQLFALKSTDQLLPAIAPSKPETGLIASTSTDPVQTEVDSSLQEMKVCKIMERCKMPILDVSVCSPLLCSEYCPQFSQPDRILNNLYHLFMNGGLSADEFVNGDVKDLCEYFGRIHFSQDDTSLLKIKALPLFKNIFSKYCAISSAEAYILPMNVCLEGLSIDVWNGNGTVILTTDGEWRKLGAASVFGIKKVSALVIYTKFIFPCFEDLSNEHRLCQLKHIRDTPELFGLALRISKLDDDTEQKEECTKFISSLKQLHCIESNDNELRPVGNFYDPTQLIFKAFPEKFPFLPPKFISEDGNRWLKFFRLIGLKSKLSKHEFTQLCCTVSERGNQVEKLQSASNALLEYLFSETDWYDDIEFLNFIARIRFVVAEPLNELSSIMPTFKNENDIVQPVGDKTVQLTSLECSSVYEYRNLVWTVMPVVKLPKSNQTEEKVKQLYSSLRICAMPLVSQVVENVLNIAKSKFANFHLFEHYSQDCIPNESHAEFLFQILVDNFNHIQQNCSVSELELLKKAPCIPVCQTGKTDEVEYPVLVHPIQVIVASEQESKQFLPFISPLPARLYQFLPGLLANIGVKQELQLSHVTNALETIRTHYDPPLKPRIVEVVKDLLKRLFSQLKNSSNNNLSFCETLYLLNTENKLMPSSSLLYDDTGRYKKAKFEDFSHTEYSVASLPSKKSDKQHKFGFHARDFCALLPHYVRPKPFSTLCNDELHGTYMPKEKHSQFAQQLVLAFERSEFGKCTQMILQHNSTDCKDALLRFEQSLEMFSKSVKVFTVSGLTVDIYLTPSEKIGTADVPFSLLKEMEEKYRLYVDEKANPEVIPKLFDMLASSIIDCVTEMAGIDKQCLNKPEKALKTILRATSNKNLINALYEMGIDASQLKLTESLYEVDMNPHIGAKIPEEWMHRLQSGIKKDFSSQELVGYEERDNFFIFALVLYKTVGDCDGTVDLPHFRVRTQEDDEEGKVVSNIFLYRILCVTQVESDLILWDKKSTGELNMTMRKIHGKLNQIQKIKDEDLRKKAKKVLYLNCHPDVIINGTPNNSEAFYFLELQIRRLEQDLPLEDPLKEDWRNSSAPQSDGQCDEMIKSWNNIAEALSNSWKREKSAIRRKIQRNARKWPTPSWNWEQKIRVATEQETAEIWIKQANFDRIALQLLLDRAFDQQSLSAHVCYLAHQVAEKSLKAGMYKRFGLHPTSLRTHNLTGHASALEIPPTLAADLKKLESYYLGTRYPNVHSPLSVPSDKFETSLASDAVETAEKIFKRMQDLVNPSHQHSNIISMVATHTTTPYPVASSKTMQSADFSNNVLSPSTSLPIANLELRSGVLSPNTSLSVAGSELSSGVLSPNTSLSVAGSELSSGVLSPDTSLSMADSELSSSRGTASGVASPSLPSCTSENQSPLTAHLDDIVTFECTSVGLEYKLAGYDIIVKVPPNAILEGEKVQFEIASCLYGPFKFPDEKRPISPIIWLCTKNRIDFKKPIEVVLPHILTGLMQDQCDQYGVCFAKADHTKHSTETPLYDFDLCDAQKVEIFSNESGNFGSLKTNHCCHLCILANKNRETALQAGYCLSRIERTRTHNDITMYSINFCATFCLSTCMEALNKQFPNEDGYKITSSHPFKFKDDFDPHIQLDITENPSCKIARTPKHGRILMSEIDFWDQCLSKEDMEYRQKANLYPPWCRLEVHLTEEERATVLTISFVGCKHNSLDMEIMFPLGTSLSHPITTAGKGGRLMASSATSVLNGDEKPEVYELQLLKLGDNEIRIIDLIEADWKKFARYLCFEEHIIRSVDQDNPSSVYDCCCSILNKWLDGNGRQPATWNTLIQVLFDFKKPEVATLLQNHVI